MDWEWITHHLISGLIPVMMALILYFLILRVLGKRQTKGHIFGSFVFCFYPIGVLTMTGICYRGPFSPEIVLNPFADLSDGRIDMFLNILLFVPMGFFLPLLYEENERFGRVVLSGLLMSLSIEIAQMFGAGKTDVSDLITNTIGTCIGFGLFKLIAHGRLKFWMKQVQVHGTKSYLELILFWIGCILIMVTVQPAVYHALFPAVSSGDLQEWK